MADTDTTKYRWNGAKTGDRTRFRDESEVLVASAVKGEDGKEGLARREAKIGEEIELTASEHESLKGTQKLTEVDKSKSGGSGQESNEENKEGEGQQNPPTPPTPPGRPGQQTR